MKKIAIVFPKDSEAFFNENSSETFGGATAQLYLIAKELYNYKNIKTYAIINDYREIKFKDENKFHLVSTFKDSDTLFSKIWKFHKQISKIKPDYIIQRGLTIFSCLLSIYCKFFRINFIFMFAHDREISGRYQASNSKSMLFPLLLKFSKLLITQSGYQMEALPNAVQSKVKIIRSGHVIEEKITTKKNHILWVGRLEPWKRPEVVIELAKKFPEHKFVVIAPIVNGYDKYGKSVAQECMTVDNIDYIPFVKFEQINDYFKNAKVFINTSFEEGFPNTFIQSCKNKTPIISLSVNPDQFINKFKCGYFCHDKFELMVKNLRTIMKNKNVYANKSTAAFNYAKEIHNIKDNVYELLDLLASKKIAVVFPKNSEAIFNKHSNRTFGGATIQMYFIAKEMGTNENIEVLSLIPEYAKIDFDENDKFNLIYTFMEKDNIIKKIWKFHKKISKHKPEVIVQRGLTLLSCFLAVYCRIINIKFVFMFAHDIETHGLYQNEKTRAFFYPLLLKYSKLLIVQNQYEYNNIPENRKYKTHILKKGLDLVRLKKSKKKIYDCVWIARCEKWKQPELFLELAKKNPKCSFFMVCSKDRDIPYFHEIKKQAGEIDNLKFYDFLDNESIYKVLSQSKVFCITSEMEGDWPMTVLESAASKMPLLSYNLSYGDLFEKYDGGFNCNGDAEYMDKNFKKLIKNKTLYEKKSDGAYRFILENHNLTKNVNELLSLL